MNPRLRRKLEDLGRALSEAISESTEASRQLTELRDEGFAVYLLLEGDADGGEGRGAVGKVAGRLPAGRAPRALPASSLEVSPSGEPAFLINGQDLALLRSLGIDPTRRPRRRRSGGDGG